MKFCSDIFEKLKPLRVLSFSFEMSSNFFWARIIYLTTLEYATCPKFFLISVYFNFIYAFSSYFSFKIFTRRSLISSMTWFLFR